MAYYLHIFCIFVAYLAPPAGAAAAAAGFQATNHREDVCSSFITTTVLDESQFTPHGRHK